MFGAGDIWRGLRAKWLECPACGGHRLTPQRVPRMPVASALGLERYRCSACYATVVLKRGLPAPTEWMDPSEDVQPQQARGARRASSAEMEELDNAVAGAARAEWAPQPSP